LIQLVVIAGVLGAVAAYAPPPSWLTDRDTYDRIGRELIIPGCSELHCFRVLVPWLLGSLPGAALVKWKTFAVLCEAGAAVAMGLLCVRFGLSRRTAVMVAWMTAFGQGSLYALFDPHSADPLMHLLAPVLTVLLFEERLVLAAVLAGVGVFAKEFAAVPLWLVAVAHALQNRWALARRVGGAAIAVTVVWAAWHIVLQQTYAYDYGGSRAVDPLGGSYVVFWLLSLSPRLVAISIFIVFGAAYILWPFGLRSSHIELRRLTFAAAPVVLIFCALQQPDRALWNFAFLVLPAGGMVLERVPSALGWSVIATFALANLRLGAQLGAAAPMARIALVASCALACGCVIWSLWHVPLRREAVA